MFVACGECRITGLRLCLETWPGRGASGWTRLGRGLSRWHKKLNEVKASASKALLRAGEGWGVLGMPPGWRDGVRFFIPSPACRKLSFLTCSVLLSYNLPFLKEEHVMTHSQQNTETTENTVSKTLSSEVSKNAIEVARKLQKIKEYNDQIDELKKTLSVQLDKYRSSLTEDEKKKAWNLSVQAILSDVAEVVQNYKETDEQGKDVNIFSSSQANEKKLMQEMKEKGSLSMYYHGPKKRGSKEG